MLAAPIIEFAQRGGTHLAYQSAGEGPLEIVYVGGSFATTLAWEEPSYSKGFRRLASFSRLVTYDQRGMGYSGSPTSRWPCRRSMTSSLTWPR